ncbi:MAG: cell division FtsA domain-containing protein [Pseudomonadota bacterium]
MRHERVIGLLDLGSSKIGCLIVAVGPSRERVPSRGALTHGDVTSAASDETAVRILGVGYTGSRGIKSGVVMDMSAAEACVRTCVAEAETVAGVTINEVHVAVSCGRLASQSFAAHAEVGSAGVQAADISRALAGGQAYARRDGRFLVQMNTIGFRLDGQPCGADPRGLVAQRLTADLTAVTADAAPVQNVFMLMQRCHLSIEQIVPAPLASGLAASRRDERQLGVTVVDIGSGVTTISMFADGELVHVDAIAVGGDRLTYEIAKELQTPLANASSSSTEEVPATVLII